MTARTSTPVGSQWDTVWSGSEHKESPMIYSELLTLAARFLDQPDIQTIQDWGCGHGQFRNFLAPHQVYIGVDACATSEAEIIADLADYETEVDAIYMRGVCEHNDRYDEILANFVASFTQRAVVVFFLPFRDKPTRSTKNILVQTFKREDVVPYFQEFIVEEYTLPKQRDPKSHEIIFCLEKTA